MAALTAAVEAADDSTTSGQWRWRRWHSVSSPLTNRKRRQGAAAAQVSGVGAAAADGTTLESAGGGVRGWRASLLRPNCGDK